MTTPAGKVKAIVKRKYKEGDSGGISGVVYPSSVLFPRASMERGCTLHGSIKIILLIKTFFYKKELNIKIGKILLIY